MKKNLFFKVTIFVAMLCCAPIFAGIIPSKYGSEKLSSYVDKFNADDEELYINTYPNSEAKKFLTENVPLFDCPDETINAVYYFRWWTFRKHVVKTPKGFVVTEFLPKVAWSDEYNVISCPAALQIREGRWLNNEKIISDYIKYWSKSKRARNYSFWFADSAYQYHLARPNLELLKEIYPSLKKNVAAWEKSHFDPRMNLFWQSDLFDGMELSISGALNAKWNGYRATINSYMIAEYQAISKIAKLIGETADIEPYAKKAAELKAVMNKKLWDSKAKFYKVMPKNGYEEKLADVRELHGYTPWYFNLAPEEYSEAWEQITDTKGFKAKFGLTSAERRDPRFQLAYIGHECQWNGPVWPYATSVTLTALANLLNDYNNAPVDKDDYFEALKTYANAHHLTKPDGKVVFWIDECQHPDTGDWITRTRLLAWDKNAPAYYKERGKDYNHSNFNELVITGLLGVRLGESDKIIINPLAPDSWKFFAIENLSCKGKKLSIIWDKNGERYGKGKGFMVFLNGEKVSQKDKIEKTEIEIK